MFSYFPISFQKGSSIKRIWQAFLNLHSDNTLIIVLTVSHQTLSVKISCLTEQLQTPSFCKYRFTTAFANIRKVYGPGMPGLDWLSWNVAAWLSEWSLISDNIEDIPLVEFVYLAFTRMACERGTVGDSGLCCCLCVTSVFQVLIDSLVCWFQDNFHRKLRMSDPVGGQSVRPLAQSRKNTEDTWVPKS